MDKILVAVYGSLRKGFGNHRLLEHAKFLGSDDITGFQMYSLGAFPGIISGHPEKAIFVEVYEVSPNELTRLDMLEGHPNFYCRHEITTKYGKAWIYVLPDVEQYNTLPVVVTGEWGSPLQYRSQR